MKLSALSDGAFDLNESAMCLDGAVAYRQAQAGAFPDTLGREKRIENSLQIFLGDATTGVGERDFSHGYGSNTQLSALKFRVIPGPDRDATVTFDGMLSIHQHVHDDLLDQVLVNPHRWQLFVDIHNDLDVFDVRWLFDQVRGFFDQLVEICECFFGCLIPRKVQQSPDDGGATLGLLNDQIEVFGFRTAIGNCFLTR